MTDPKTRFSRTVENYRKYRPRYPAGLCDLMAKRVGFGLGSRVAELGAGTGILTSDLLDYGAQVIAVEPNEAMRMAAEDALGERDGFHSVQGSAESTQLLEGSVQGVIAAQAFHWFDPASARREALRICGETGWAAIVWNTRRLVGSDFAEAYESFCRRWGVDYDKVASTYADPSGLETFFGGKTPQRDLLSNAQALDREGLRGRLLSCSYIPGPEDPGYKSMLTHIDAIFDAHQDDDEVWLEYDTELFSGPLS